MTVAVAPVVGPVLGGWLAEVYSWRWAFYMLVPVGVCGADRHEHDAARRHAG